MPVTKTKRFSVTLMILISNGGCRSISRAGGRIPRRLDSLGTSRRTFKLIPRSISRIITRIDLWDTLSSPTPFICGVRNPRPALQLRSDRTKRCCGTGRPDRNSPPMRSSQSDRAVVATFLCLSFLWTLALSASPQLHQRIHRDANRGDHVCAVTMVASGNYNHSPSAPPLNAPVLAQQFSPTPALTPQWVESAFLFARIFEHGPPAHS